MLLNCMHFKCLFKKNLILLRRNWVGLCLEIMISILCIMAMVIYRKLEDKVYVPEKSYLSEQTTIYPSIVINNSQEYYDAIKNMSIKYNFLFPIPNYSIFKYVLYKPGTNLINITALPSRILTNSHFDISHVTNSDKFIRLLADATKLDINLLSPEDQIEVFNIAEEIASTNSMKNCQNPVIGGTLGLSPLNALTIKIAKMFALLYYDILFFDNDSLINDYVKTDDYNEKRVPNLCFAISFTSMSRNEGYSYSLRFHQANPIHEVYETNQPWRTHPYKKEWIDKYEKYRIYGFLTMQNWIDNLIFQQEMNNPMANITFDISSVKTPNYYKDDLPAQLNGKANIFTIIAYLLPFLKLIYCIVYEKEKRIKEGMKMMGMDETAFYLSWLLVYFLLFMFLSIINSLLLNLIIFTFSNYFMVFLIQALYTMSIMFFALLITAFFSRTKTAVIAGIFLLFIQYLMTNLVGRESVDFSFKAAASLSPVIAMSLALNIFLELESTETGITIDTVNDMFNNYNISTAIAFFWISSIVFILLFIYFEQVFPNEFGIKQSPLFFLQCCCKKRKKTYYSLNNNNDASKNGASYLVEMSSNREFADNLMSPAERPDDSFEKVTNNLIMQKKDKKTIEIKGLTKIFDNGKTAVNNLSFTMYDNQIFVLLGVNGAGKTTTFSMLTGLMPQTSGNVSYFEYDINNDMQEIRKFMGVCPQFDILFDNLTVKEHLELYATLKGMSQADIPQTVEKMIKDLKLEEKMNYLSKTLSGGQKRKLSTGIAFIGGSKLIFLDEPTTGMDPTSRRVLWDVLKTYKENKIIILTTHFMDEAEYLGDRIGIMGEGVMKCCGSPVFLKNLYGIGYNLTIIKSDTDENPEIYKTIHSIVKGSKILSEASANLVCQLPMEEVGKFKELCNTLDQNLKILKINSYGISITSLEEVFLKVAQNRKIHEKDELIQTQDPDLEKEDYILSEIRVKSLCILYLGQFRVLFLKRIYYLKRDLKSLISEIVLPVALMAIGLALLYSEPIEDPISITMSPRLYNDYKVLYSGENQSDFFQYYDNSNEYFDTSLNASLWDQDIYADRTTNQKGSYYITDFNESILNFTYKLIVNTTSPDTAPLFVNQMNQMIMRKMLNFSNFSLKISNYPLAFCENDKETEFIEYQFFTAILFTLAFAFIPSSLVVFFVKERQYKMKHEQMISGMKSWIYWLTNFIFDLPKCMIPVICCLFIVQAFKVRGLSTDDSWDALWVLFILYIINIIPFTYITSFLFDEYGYAQTVSFTLHLMISTVLTLVIGLLRVMSNTINFAKAIAYLFRLIPSFAFGYGTFNIANRRVYAFIDQYWFPKSPFDLDIAGTEMLYLGVTAGILWILLILIEVTDEGEAIKTYFNDRKMKKTSYFKAATMGIKKDQDIQDEKDRLMKMGPDELLLKVVDMKKYFYVPYDKNKIKLAVDSLCLGTSKGECFCLLGVNGAGKTTTFRMLTGEIKPDEGEIYINGVNAIKNINGIRDKIGYCPQIDPLLDILSVEEHLYLFAGLKGIPQNMKKDMIEQKMKNLDLVKFRNISTFKLSGGNKRKLSFAIATLGNPALVFLDEPSSGMDPESRRFMWNAISKFSGKNSKNSVILTTHLMEEAEALGTRLGIMVNGSFHCLGNTQYLKKRFGKGYELEIVTEIPTNGDLELLAKQYNMDIKTTLNLNEIMKLLDGMNMNELAKDFRDSEKIAHLFSNSKITFELFAEYCIIEQIGQRVVEFLKKDLGKCEVIEHLYSFFRLKLETVKSISFLFGILEDNKEFLHIKYYSIRQTTLEQIFNMFATGQIVDEDIEANYPRENNKVYQKTPTLIKGYSMPIQEDVIGTIADPIISQNPEKKLNMLNKMGSIGPLALEELNKNKFNNNSKKSKVFNFITSVIENGKNSSMGNSRRITDEFSVGCEEEIKEIQTFQGVPKNVIGE